MSSPIDWRYPPSSYRIAIVAGVYAVTGFLGGAMVGMLFGGLLVGAIVGSIAGALFGAQLEWEPRRGEEVARQDAERANLYDHSVLSR